MKYVLQISGLDFVACTKAESSAPKIFTNSTSCRRVVDPRRISLSIIAFLSHNTVYMFHTHITNELHYETKKNHQN